MHPGLEKIRALLDDLGNPHNAYAIVHVAGTNGKGSVCSMVSAMMTLAGRRTGLHTSPHLRSLTERFRVDGKEADEDWVASAVERLAPSIRRVRPSFFEATTALALLYFADKQVDVAVIEVGMGGRLDATNIVTPVLSVITNIGFDHTDQLGGTLPEIAREKAGIIKPGVPVVTGACRQEVMSVIDEVAAALGAPVVNVCRPPWNIEYNGQQIQLSTAHTTFKPFSLDLPGRHQHSNALVAVAAAQALVPGDGLADIVTEALSNTRRLSGLRARCEIVQREPLVMVDVAHNEEGVRAALQCLDEESQVRDAPHVMLGLARDKDLHAILDALEAWKCILIPVAIPGQRGLPPVETIQAAKKRGLRIVEIDTMEQGWKYFREHAEVGSRLLVTGSHYLVGALPEDLFPRCPATPI
jgi:dihydrofolate synthase/folylpolyglutamate synthase